MSTGFPATWEGKTLYHSLLHTVFSENLVLCSLRPGPIDLTYSGVQMDLPVLAYSPF